MDDIAFFVPIGIIKGNSANHSSIDLIPRPINEFGPIQTECIIAQKFTQFCATAHLLSHPSCAGLFDVSLTDSIKRKNTPCFITWGEKKLVSKELISLQVFDILFLSARPESIPGVPAGHKEQYNDHNIKEQADDLRKHTGRTKTEHISQHASQQHAAADHRGRTQEAVACRWLLHRLRWFDCCRRGLVAITGRWRRRLIARGRARRRRSCRSRSRRSRLRYAGCGFWRRDASGTAGGSETQ